MIRCSDSILYFELIWLIRSIELMLDLSLKVFYPSLFSFFILLRLALSLSLSLSLSLFSLSSLSLSFFLSPPLSGAYINIKIYTKMMVFFVLQCFVLYLNWPIRQIIFTKLYKGVTLPEKKFLCILLEKSQVVHFVDSARPLASHKHFLSDSAG